MKRQKKAPKPVLNEAALEYFRRMGAIGGRRTAANLTAEQRKAIALKASNARWNKQDGEADGGGYDNHQADGHPRISQQVRQ